jgi:plastocyanin
VKAPIRAAGLALAAALGLASLALAAQKAARHTVLIDGTSYRPQAITVKAGDTVVWTNKDPFPHTVTAKGAFDSKGIAAGASWKHVMRKPGTYEYVCSYHPNMKGTVEVR